MKTKRSIWLIPIGLLTLCFIALGGRCNVVAYAQACDHQYETVTIDATCTEQGYTESICTLCGDCYQDCYTEATGHRFADIVVSPTCTEQGFTAHLCLDCGYQFTSHYTDPVGHQLTDVVFEPTCTEQGFVLHTCEICNLTYTDQYKEALGHDYKTETTDATCTTDGFTTYSCLRCGESHTEEETNATGHQYIRHQVEATCDAYGYTEQFCANCATRYVSDYIKPLGHEYHDEIVEAGRNQLGYTKHTCLRCGYIYLSDFSTSEDNGYIDKPIDPIPPVHTHSYTLDVSVNRIDKTLFLAYTCSCQEENTDQLLVTFTDKDENTLCVCPEDHKVSYQALNGTIQVVITNAERVTLRSFTIVADDPTIELPDVPTPPVEEHTHQWVLQSENNDNDRYLWLNYACVCGTTANETLSVIFIDEASQEIALSIDKDGIVDYAALSGKYRVIVQTKMDILTEFTVQAKQEEKDDEPNPLDPSDSKTETEQPNETDDKRSGIAIVLSVIFVLLVGAGVATILVIKKQNKTKKGE